jgi:hypothetical protein
MVKGEFFHVVIINLQATARKDASVVNLNEIFNRFSAKS